MADFTLVPGTYKCREHDRDLTAAVRSRIEEGAVDVSGGFGYQPRQRGAQRESSFKVRVWCDGPERHELVFRGRRRA